MKQTTSTLDCDVAVVGAGIVGISHALAAVRRGAKVVLLDAAPKPVSASIRNFGFVTVTGQERHEMWPLAYRSRRVWAEVADKAGIAIQQTGLIMAVRRPEAEAVLQAFMETEMGEQCELVSGPELATHAPGVPFGGVTAALISPHEARVEAREAIPKLLTWLNESMGVQLLLSSPALQIMPGNVVTPDATVKADKIFVCPGDHLSRLYPQLAREMGVRPCKLQMLRLAPPGYRLPSPVMSDLGLVRYEGYASLPEAAALKSRLVTEQSAHLEAGVHLIAVQSVDGSLVVGDSHDYSDPLDPFLRSDVDDLMLDEFQTVLGPVPAINERWVGTYAWSPDRNWFTCEVDPGVHVTVITCGAGMSTAFAIGEDVVDAALNTARPVAH